MSIKMKSKTATCLFDKDIGIDFQWLRQEGVNADVHIIAGNGPNQKTFKAHACILTLKSALFPRLRERCKSGILAAPTVHFYSSYFASLTRDELFNLVNSEDLNMDEVLIWNAIIRWGKAKTPPLSDDPTNWTDS